MTIRVNAWLIERSDQLQPIPPRDIEDIQAPEGGGMGWYFGVLRIIIMIVTLRC